MYVLGKCFIAASLNNFSKNLCNKFLGFIAKVLDIQEVCYQSNQGVKLCT